jgi:uncharacterized protein
MLRLLAARAHGLCVRDARVGLRYTAVRLSDGSCGMAMNFLADVAAASTQLGDLRPLCGQPASALLALLEAGDPVLVSLGVACANAIASGLSPPAAPGDALAHVTLRPGDTVAMIGFFRSMAGQVRRQVKQLRIFELIARRDGDLFPARDAYRFLPRCDVALITGTTVVNGTIDPLLAACTGARDVVVLGPTTPLIPRAYTGTPVTLICGSRILRPAPVLRIISEGGGAHSCQAFLQKMNIAIKNGRLQS